MWESVDGIPSVNQNWKIQIWITGYGKLKDLNYWLSKFWFEVRTAEENYYRVSSLEHLHYGIKRLLKNYSHEYDITKSEFLQITKSFLWCL